MPLAPCGKKGLTPASSAERTPFSGLLAFVLGYTTVGRCNYLNLLKEYRCHGQKRNAESEYTVDLRG